MELKFKDFFLFPNFEFLLQSHLYGIEILMYILGAMETELLQSHLYGIEIRTFVIPSKLFQVLQSHLYGIEIGDEQEQTGAEAKTPIAPLWN